MAEGDGGAGGTVSRQEWAGLHDGWSGGGGSGGAMGRTETVQPGSGGAMLRPDDHVVIHPVIMGTAATEPGTLTPLPPVSIDRRHFQAVELRENGVPVDPEMFARVRVQCGGESLTNVLPTSSAKPPTVRKRRGCCVCVNPD